MNVNNNCGVSLPCPGQCLRAGYGFVPMQDVERFFNYESAFVSGTVFPDLSIPKGQYGPGENFSDK